MKTTQDDFRRSIENCSIRWRAFSPCLETNVNIFCFSRRQIERFNALLRIIKASLIDLEKGIKGLVVMSSDLEETFYCIYDAKVPPLWGKVRKKSHE